MSQPRPDDDELARALHDSRELHEAPEALLQRTVALFEPRARAAGPRRSLLTRLAELRFDSGGADELAFGVRAHGGDVRQFLYTLDGRDIDLRVEPAEGAAGWLLSGQVMGPDSAGVVVLEPEHGDVAAAVTLDELGEFRLPAVADGLYRLMLELADQVIVLPPLQLPPSA